MSSEDINASVVRVLVADSTPMGSQLILEALRQDNRFNVVGVLTAPEEVAALVSELNPHVAVIGIGANGGARKGFALLRHGLARHPEVKPVMLLDTSIPDLVVEAFRSGARGVVCRSDSLNVLRNCVYAVHSGQIWADNDQLGFVLEFLTRRQLPQSIVDSRGNGLLSKREIDVVRCVSDGMTNREIALQLALSEHTVKNYLFRIFDKLGVSNRAELLVYAMHHGGFTQESPHFLTGSNAVAADGWSGA